MNIYEEDKSGFFPIEVWESPCSDPGHNFPTHLHIPIGMGYKHVCPSCGKTQTVINNGPIC